MATNEERRKVAARLRTLAGHAPADEEMVLDALDLYPGEYIEGFDPECVRRLADLIEPEAWREQLDTWMKLANDVNDGDSCKYFGHAGTSCHHNENECPAYLNPNGCFHAMLEDFLRRCKALAGVE